MHGAARGLQVPLNEGRGLHGILDLENAESGMRVHDFKGGWPGVGQGHSDGPTPPGGEPAPSFPKRVLESNPSWRLAEEA